MHIHTPNPEKLMVQVEQDFNDLYKTLPLTLQLSSSPSTYNNNFLNKIPLPTSAFIPTKFPSFTSKPNNEVDFTNGSQMLCKEIPSITAQKAPILPLYDPQQMAAILSMLYSMNPSLVAARTPSFVGSRFEQFLPTNSTNIRSNTMLEQVSHCENL